MIKYLNNYYIIALNATYPLSHASTSTKYKTALSTALLSN